MRFTLRDSRAPYPNGIKAKAKAKAKDVEDTATQAEVEAVAKVSSDKSQWLQQQSK